MQTISLGVREFALPTPRVGSIDSQSGYGALPQSGQDVHNAFLNKRKRQIAGYEIEVKLSRRFSLGGYEINVSGRVDGLARENQSRPVIEEIKTDLDIHRLANLLRSGKSHPYILQLLSYGYFYQEEHGQQCDLRMILVSMKDASSTTINLKLDKAEYESWLDRRLKELVEEYETIQIRRERRRNLADELKFPYHSMRPGQEELGKAVSSVLDGGRSCLIQAPTGLGKTAGVLYPALKASLAEGDQVVYVTAKNSQHEAVVEATRLLNGCGVSRPLKTLVLTAKSKVCLKDEVYCHSDYCEFARDYYEKVDAGKLQDKASGADVMDADHFVALGKKHRVCPFELSLDCVSRADIVVGDYNYVFSPRNVMGRFLPGPFKEKGHQPILLVDEAHNLPDRAKGYYGGEISEERLLDIKARIAKKLPNYSIAGQALVEEVLKIMRGFADKGGRYSVRQIRISAGLFEPVRNKIGEYVQTYLRSSMLLLERDPVLELNNLVSDFVDALDYDGDEFVVLAKPEGGGTLKVVCLDAAQRLTETYKKSRSTIAFSATLKPFEYFANVLGFDTARLDLHEFDSPFSADNRKLLIVPQISTKYADRPKNYGKISEVIKRVTRMKEGNYLVLFPSFAFLEEVLRITRLDHAAILVQERVTPRNKVRETLDKLKDSEKSHVLFAVQGGIFAEGIDYPGDMLIGAIVVGPGLPKFDLETELLQSYFDKKYSEGYKYTFVYPAMAKVTQSAGRVIRSEKDRGLILLLGRRFLTPPFMEAMPGYWLAPGKEKLVSQAILSDVDKFWRASSIMVEPAGKK